MKSDKRKVIGNKPESSPSGRRSVVILIGLGLMMPLAACGKGGKIMSGETVLDVVMYSNLDRQIHDIIFNGTDLGVTNSYGTTGTVTGVRIPFGIQKLTWTLGGPKGMARNGEKIQVKNAILISSQQIPNNAHYIGLNLYPDDTAEITFGESIPERTPRGKNIRANRK